MIVIDRSLLTDLLLATLEPSEDDPFDFRDWIVGDHEKPPLGGWQEEAGHSDWVPYVVLTALPSQSVTGDLATPDSDVWFGYAVTAAGKSRLGAEKVSMVARERFATLQRQKTSDDRTISRVMVSRYGGVDRIKTEPPQFLVTDQFRIYTTK